MDLYDQLNQLNFDQNLVIVEAKDKHQKSLLRIFAHKCNLNYRYYHYDEFDYTTYYQCKECKKKMANKEMMWITDYSIISGNPIGCFGRCPDCWDNVYYPEYGPNDEDNKQHFKVWSPANAVIIGLNLGRYTRKESDRGFKKKPGDQTWKLDRLREALNNNCENNKLKILALSS